VEVGARGVSLRRSEAKKKKVPFRRNAYPERKRKKEEGLDKEGKRNAMNLNYYGLRRKLKKVAHRTWAKIPGGKWMNMVKTERKRNGKTRKIP